MNTHLTDLGEKQMSYKILNEDGSVRTHTGQEVYGCDMIESLMERDQ
jgi:hypothetical protein